MASIENLFEQKAVDIVDKMATQIIRLDDALKSADALIERAS